MPATVHPSSVRRVPALAAYLVVHLSVCPFVPRPWTWACLPCVAAVTGRHARCAAGAPPCRGHVWCASGRVWGLSRVARAAVRRPQGDAIGTVRPRVRPCVAPGRGVSVPTAQAIRPDGLSSLCGARRFGPFPAPVRPRSRPARPRAGADGSRCSRAAMPCASRAVAARAGAPPACAGMPRYPQTKEMLMDSHDSPVPLSVAAQPALRPCPRLCEPQEVRHGVLSCIAAPPGRS